MSKVPAGGPIDWSEMNALLPTLDRPIPTEQSKEQTLAVLKPLAPWRYRVQFSNGADTGELERAAPFVANIHTKVAQIWPWIRSMVPPNFSVLDVGCCLGHHRFGFFQLGCQRYVGVEVAERNVRMAEAISQCAAPDQGSASIIHGDIASARLNEQFDVIICLAVLNNVNGIYEAVGRIRAVSKPSAVLVFENLVADEPGDRPGAIYFEADGYMGDKTLRWIFTLSGFDNLLRHFGFSQIEHKFVWKNAAAIGEGMAKVITVVRV